jgi:hypothetical protein
LQSPRVLHGFARQLCSASLFSSLQHNSRRWQGSESDSPFWYFGAPKG